MCHNRYITLRLLISATASVLRPPPAILPILPWAMRATGPRTEQARVSPSPWRAPPEAAACFRQRLNMRDFMDTLRASGIHAGGPPALRKQFAPVVHRLFSRRVLQIHSPFPFRLPSPFLRPARCPPPHPWLLSPFRCRVRPPRNETEGGRGNAWMVVRAIRRCARLGGGAVSRGCFAALVRALPTRRLDQRCPQARRSPSGCIPG